MPIQARSDASEAQSFCDYAGRCGKFKNSPAKLKGQLSIGQRHLIRWRVRERSASSEQALDIAQLQFNIGRASMVACAGTGGCLHFTQQRIHLFRPQAATSAH